jgi:hypothetical protein
MNLTVLSKRSAKAPIAAAGLQWAWVEISERNIWVCWLLRARHYRPTLRTLLSWWEWWIALADAHVISKQNSILAAGPRPRLALVEFFDVLHCDTIFIGQSATIIVLNDKMRLTGTILALLRPNLLRCIVGLIIVSTFFS